MSWLERIQSDLVITTGDGREYRPLWKPTTKSVEFNVAEFDFPETDGTLVKRSRPKGNKYSLDIYFQGDNCIDEANSFNLSSIDNRPWTISHPYHGSINVQPTGLSFDFSNFNVVVITGTIIETITEDKPKVTIDPVDKIAEDKESLDETFETSFDVVPDTSDINALNTSNDKIYTQGARAIRLTDEAEEYFNLYNKANAAVLNATDEPLAAVRATQAMISYPALLSESVEARINVLTDQFDSLSDSVDTITDRSLKKIYENNAGTTISAMCLTAATPITGDYRNRNKVLRIVERILDTHRTFLEYLDSLQSENGGEPESYIPDASSIMALGDLVGYTVSNLFDIALQSKQERTVYIEDDSNIILLAHRFYGLTPDDSTIDELINNNDIGLNEILQIRKGRRIVYYV